jgi:hypothetical protein
MADQSLPGHWTVHSNTIAGNCSVVERCLKIVKLYVKIVKLYVKIVKLYVKIVKLYV